MNKRLSLLTAALLLTCASSAFAASSTDLTVTGIITPGVCTPSLANSGIVDYGKRSAKDLNPTAHTPLGIETIQLTVNCDASTQFALKTSDNREGTASLGGSGSGTFGLGLINTNEKLGFYQLSFMSPVADTPVTALYSRNKGDTWNRLWDDDGITSADWVAFGNRTGSVWTPDFVQNVTVDIAVNTQIAPANSLTLTDEVTLDGSATLQIEYL
jgi:type 1 fimbria pilin